MTAHTVRADQVDIGARVTDLGIHGTVRKGDDGTWPATIVVRDLPGREVGITLADNPHREHTLPRSAAVTVVAS